MPPKKKRKTSTKKVEKINDGHLPGTLMIAFGILGLALNFDLIAELQWAKAYPLLAVLFGFVVLAKVIIDE
ncbi:hypothetical protein JXA56_00980 [Candidatus Micrarchaeota archaeon]|nr:hypothetical protein [Candidatus Micrarchaeota archaeon]